MVCVTSYNSADIPDILQPWGGDVNPAIFTFAHQDDETLTFGAEIEAHKSAGRYCIGVLGTDGRSSTVRQLTGLDVEGFVKARNLELMSAASILGLDELHFSGGKDGSLTQAQADAIANFWYQRYPTGSFKVPSDQDNNADHKAIGVAFRKVKNANTTADIRFYVKPEQRAQFTGLRVTTPTGTNTVTAYAEYKRVDNPNGRYGIGYLSVRGDFDSTIANPISTWHF